MSNILARWYRWHRPMAVFVMTMAVLVVVAGIGVLVDDRYLAGAPVWLKPFKFGVSFLIYALSLGWVLGQMNRQRPRRWVIAVGTGFAVTSFAELMLITVQAARARESHFNSRQDPLDGPIGGLMVLMVIGLWAASLIIALVAARRGFGDRATTSAVRYGLVIAVIGAALGALMVIPTAEQQAAAADGLPTLLGAHSVGVPHGGPGLPVTGWSTDGGDLRIPHFVGIHGLQALPLLAAVLARPRLGLTEHARLRLVRLGAACYAGLVAITLAQALRAQPLLAPDGWTLLALALLATTIGIGVGRVLRGPRASSDNVSLPTA